MKNDLTTTFESAFDELLEKSNFAHELRLMGAGFDERIQATAELFDARVEAAVQRHALADCS